MTRQELGRLYERYGGLVHRRCCALLRSELDAADAVQETFLRVQRYGGPTELREPIAWLYSVAANVCFDKRARRTRDAQRQEHEDVAATLAQVGSPDDGDRRAVVGTILTSFDDVTRRIGVLHHLDGLTQEEIAMETGYSRKTVGRRLSVFEATFQAMWRAATGGPT